MTILVVAHQGIFGRMERWSKSGKGGIQVRQSRGHPQVSCQWRTSWWGLQITRVLGSECPRFQLEGFWSFINFCVSTWQTEDVGRTKGGQFYFDITVPLGLEDTSSEWIWLYFLFFQVKYRGVSVRNGAYKSSKVMRASTNSNGTTHVTYSGRKRISWSIFCLCQHTYSNS